MTSLVEHIVFFDVFQDAQEQKKRLDCLLFRGPLVPNVGEYADEHRLTHFVVGLIFKRAGTIDLGSISSTFYVQLLRP